MGKSRRVCPGSRIALRASGMTVEFIIYSVVRSTHQRVAAVVEELLDGDEEALGLRVGLFATILGEYFEQLALLGAQIHRRFHQQFDMKIAALF